MIEAEQSFGRYVFSISGERLLCHRPGNLRLAGCVWYVARVYFIEKTVHAIGLHWNLEVSTLV